MSFQRGCVVVLSLLTLAITHFGYGGEPRLNPENGRKKLIPYRKHVPLSGKVVGILLTDGQPILSTEGRSGPKDQLCFAIMGGSYRWVYVPTNQKATIQNLRVPIANGEKIIYPSLTMANPESVKRWGIVAPYTLVEVEVNSGKGSPSNDSFVATNMRILEGTDEYPIKMTDIVERARKLHAVYVAKQKQDMDAEMKRTEAAVLKGRKRTGPREQSDLMYLTWHPESKQAHVYFHTKVTDGAYTYVQGGARPIRPFPLPAPNGKKIIPPPPGRLRALPPPPPRFKVRIGVTYGVEFGVEYVASVDGKIRQTQSLPMQSFHRELSPPPGANPGPFPLPVKRR